MVGNLHQCFTLAHVEALGSVEEIHTQADRHAVRGIWSSFFHLGKVQAFGSSVAGSQACWVSSHRDVSLKQSCHHFPYLTFISLLYLELQSGTRLQWVVFGWYTKSRTYCTWWRLNSLWFHRRKVIISKNTCTGGQPKEIMPEAFFSFDLTKGNLKYQKQHICQVLHHECNKNILNQTLAFSKSHDGIQLQVWFHWDGTVGRNSVGNLAENKLVALSSKFQVATWNSMISNLWGAKLGLEAEHKIFFS